MFNDDFSSSGGFTGTQRTGLFDDWGYTKSDEALGITSSSNPAAFDVTSSQSQFDTSIAGSSVAYQSHGNSTYSGTWLDSSLPLIQRARLLAYQAFYAIVLYVVISTVLDKIATL